MCVDVMKYKGVDLLVEALRDFPYPFELTVGGFCRAPEIIDGLQKQIATHPQAASIRWPNEYVKEADIQGMFTGSQRHIDQSGVLFQALRFGLPIVATKVGSLANYVSTEVGEVCEPEDVAGLRLALIRLAERYGAIDRQAIVGIGKKYEWQNTVSVLENAYQ
jgi:glycosyltransferase involved in cell wall biosynthesis